MAYAQELMEGAIIRKSNALDTAEVLSASPAVYGGYLIAKRIHVMRLCFYVTATVVSDVAVQVEFNRRPTYNSATGEELIGTLIIPSGTAAGQVVYKDIPLTVLEVGDELSFEHTVQASGGSAAGAGFYAFVAELAPETPMSEDNMIESA